MQGLRNNQNFLRDNGKDNSCITQGWLTHLSLPKKRMVLDSVRDQNDNLLESINEFQIYQWLCQISAIHMDIAKEKITSVSPQLALPYLLSILQPLWLHYPKSRCNKQVTIKKKKGMNTRREKKMV